MRHRTQTESSRIGLTSLVIVGLILSLGWATSAFAAANRYSLTGNSRTQIGNGLPLPITFQPAPNGKIPFSGSILQTVGPDPKKISPVAQSGLTFGPITATIGLFNANSNVFQIQTSLVVTGPVAGGTFEAGGGGIPSRTQFTWCPGQPLPNATFNPACTNPLATGAGIQTQGSIRYEKTVAQFGGFTTSRIGGRVNLALRPPGAAAAPCSFGTNPNCVAAFSDFSPAPYAILGQPIGYAYINLAPAPAKIYQVKMLGTATFFQVGRVSSVGPGPLGSFPPNAVKTYGGPFTTGKVTVKAPNVGETFYMQGADNRVNGIGSISLVAGGVSARANSGDNANRGWLNYTMGGIVPTVSNTGLVLIALLFAAITTWMLRRAMVQTS